MIAALEPELNRICQNTKLCPETASFHGFPSAEALAKSNYFKRGENGPSFMEAAKSYLFSSLAPKRLGGEGEKRTFFKALNFFFLNLKL